MQLTLPIGVRLMCLLFTTLLNIIIEDIVTQSLENYNGTTSIRGGGVGVVRSQTSVLLVLNLDTAATNVDMDKHNENNQDNDNNEKSWHTTKIHHDILTGVGHYRQFIYLVAKIYDDGSRG